MLIVIVKSVESAEHLLTDGDDTDECVAAAQEDDSRDMLAVVRRQMSMTDPLYIIYTSGSTTSKSHDIASVTYDIHQCLL